MSVDTLTPTETKEALLRYYREQDALAAQKAQLAQLAPPQETQIASPQEAPLTSVDEVPLTSVDEVPPATSITYSPPATYSSPATSVQYNNTVNITCPIGYLYTNVSPNGVITCTRQSETSSGLAGPASPESPAGPASQVDFGSPAGSVRECPHGKSIQFDANDMILGCPINEAADKFILCPVGFQYVDIGNTIKCFMDPKFPKDMKVDDSLCLGGNVLVNNNGSYSCVKSGEPVSDTKDSLNNSCPANTVVLKQTVGNDKNTTSCYDANGVIIGSPINNEEPLPDVCKSDSRVNNFLLRKNTAYVQCNTGDVPLVTSNICSNGYKIAITPELKSNGELSYGCIIDRATSNNQTFTCPFNITPIKTEDPTYGTLYKCTIPSSAHFTNVNEFKSRKGRNVENFSQNTNGKCKTRY